MLKRNTSFAELDWLKMGDLYYSYMEIYDTELKSEK
jgi:hypothetical protein